MLLCHTIAWVLRLWGSTGTDKYPIDPSSVVSARQQGIVRSKATDVFQEEMPEFTHQPLLQTMMQQETLDQYVPPCWVKGHCSKNLPDGIRSSHYGLLRRLLWKNVRSQINQKLPPSLSKEYLCSGDLAIAVRYGGKSLAASELQCMFFLVASMSLKPVSGVLASMLLDTEKAIHEREKSDDCNGNNVSFASLEIDPTSGHFVFQSSLELVERLLQKQAISESVIYVSVLEHKPVLLGSKFWVQTSVNN